MNKNNLLLKFSELYPIGKLKYAPGTIASLFTCILFFFLNSYFNFNVIIIIFIIVTFISFIATKIYVSQYGNKDHKSIVIDEFVGQYLALTVIPALGLDNNFKNISLVFLLFRFFDISKIGLKNIEKLPEPYGILFDDIIAGVYTIILIVLIYL